MSREPRPDDSDYYEWRTEHLRQGDLFAEVPLGLQLPAEAFNHGDRKFVAGPFEVGFAMLITPSCSMAAQGQPGSYAHPFRTVVPVWPLEQLVAEGAIKPAATDDLRRFDHLGNYMYLPAIEGAQMPESLALLYAPTTLHHELECPRFRGHLNACAVRRGRKDVRSAQDQAAVSRRVPA